MYSYSHWYGDNTLVHHFEEFVGADDNVATCESLDENFSTSTDIIEDCPSPDDGDELLEEKIRPSEIVKL